jgi:hypothetical protein
MYRGTNRFQSSSAAVMRNVTAAATMMAGSKVALRAEVRSLDPPTVIAKSLAA